MFTKFFNRKKSDASEDRLDAMYEKLQKEFNSLPNPKWTCFEFETNEQVCEWLNNEIIQVKVIKRDDVIHKDGKYMIFALYDEYILRRKALKIDLDFFYQTI